MLYENYKHSASSGNSFLSAPDQFVYKWGLRNWGEDNARTAMGMAAERTVADVIFYFPEIALDDESIKARSFVHYDSIMAGELTAEREAVPKIVARFVEYLKHLGPPKLYQSVQTVPGADFALDHDVKIQTDFEWDDLIIDLKATMRCPSKIGSNQAKHTRQQALYSYIRDKPVRLLYASPSNLFAYDLTDDDVHQGFWDLHAAFCRIEALDRICPTVQDAIDLIPFCPEHWWDEKERAKARLIWQRKEMIDAV